MSLSSSTVGGKIKYKIVLLGDQHVGKTSIIERFINDRFESNYSVPIHPTRPPSESTSWWGISTTRTKTTDSNCGTLPARKGSRAWFQATSKTHIFASWSTTSVIQSLWRTSLNGTSCTTSTKSTLPLRLWWATRKTLPASTPSLTKTMYSRGRGGNSKKDERAQSFPDFCQDWGGRGVAVPQDNRPHQYKVE